MGELGGTGARLGQEGTEGCCGELRRYRRGGCRSAAGASAGQCSSSARAGLAAAALPLVVLASLRFG